MDKDVMEEIRELVKIQGKDGNWNNNEYMRGLFNGMELILATIENRKPEFKESPNGEDTAAYV